MNRSGSEKLKALSTLFEQEVDWPEIVDNAPKGSSPDYSVHTVKHTVGKLLNTQDNRLAYVPTNATNLFTMLISELIINKVTTYSPQLDLAEFRRLALDENAEPASPPKKYLRTVSGKNRSARISALLELIEGFDTIPITKKLLLRAVSAQDTFEERYALMKPLRELGSSLHTHLEMESNGFPISADIRLASVPERIASIEPLLKDLEHVAFIKEDRVNTSELSGDIVIDAIKKQVAIEKQASEIAYNTLSAIKIKLEQIFPSSPDLPEKGNGARAR